MQLELLQEKHLRALQTFETTNRRWFEQWVPPRPAEYFTVEGFEKFNEALLHEIALGDGLYYLAVSNDEIIGRFNLSHINDGRAEIGYRVGQKHIGKGYGFLFAKQLIEQAEVAGMVHLKAEALIENIASTKVLLKLGFERDATPPRIVDLRGSAFHLAAYDLYF